MTAKKQTYDEAVKKLEAIVAQIESNELDMDSLAGKLKEAKELIKLCKERLYQTEEEIQKLLTR